jgi:hypothetical protein
LKLGNFYVDLCVFTIYHIKILESQPLMRESNSRFNGIAIVASTALFTGIFTVAFIWSIYQEHLLSLLLFTTLQLVALLIDIGYIGNQMTMLHLVDMCIAAIIVIIGFRYVFLVSDKIEDMIRVLNNLETVRIRHMDMVNVSNQGQPSFSGVRNFN